MYTTAVKYDQLLEIQRASGLRPIKFATLFFLLQHYYAAQPDSSRGTLGEKKL